MGSDHQHLLLPSEIRWLSSLAYLADIFNVLNTLNSNLQGTSVTALPVQDKIQATFKKLKLWCNRIEEKKYDSFHMLSELSEQPLSSDVAESVIEHMRSLASQHLYFPLCPEKNDWMKTPFLDSGYELPFVEGEQLIELSCDSTFKMLFPSLPLVGFGSKRRLFTLKFPKGL
jgi:hypothetical protein